MVGEELPHQTHQDFRIQLKSERTSRTVTFRSQGSNFQGSRRKPVEMVSHCIFGILGRTRNYSTKDGLFALFRSHWYTPTPSDRYRRSKLSPTTTRINTHFDRTHHSASNHTPEATRTAQNPT